MAKHLTPAEKAAIVARYVETANALATAREFGVNEVTVRRAVKAAKLTKKAELHARAVAAAIRKARKLLAEVEERELRLAVKRELYVPLDVVRQEWTTRVGRSVSLLRNKFENELPPILSGLDATGIQDECRKAIDEVLGLLHAVDDMA